MQDYADIPNEISELKQYVQAKQGKCSSIILI